MTIAQRPEPKSVAATTLVRPARPPARKTTAPRPQASRTRPHRALSAPGNFLPADSNQPLSPCNITISGLNGERAVNQSVGLPC